jgi:hypothetical protein
MVKHQITAIRKPNRYSTHEHITHVKYDGTVHTRENTISLIRAGTDAFYVKVGTNLAWVEVVYPGFPPSPFIRTTPDWTGKDNLLSLPEC